MAFSIGVSNPPWIWGFIITAVPCRGGSISYTKPWGTVLPCRSAYIVTFIGTPSKLSARRSASISAISVYSICSRTLPSVCRYSIRPMGNAGSASSANCCSTSTLPGISPAGSSTSCTASISRRYLSFMGFSFSKSKNSCRGYTLWNRGKEGSKRVTSSSPRESSSYCWTPIYKVSPNDSLYSFGFGGGGFNSS